MKRILLKTTLSLLLTFLMICSWSQSFASDALDRWSISSLKSGKYPDGREYQLQVLQRITGAQGRVYPIATLSVLWQEQSASDKINRQQLIKDISLGFGIDSWDIEKNGDADIYAGNLPNQSRRVRIAIVQTDRGIAVSSATFRIGYRDVLDEEVEAIQTAWTRKYSVVKRTSMLWDVVVSKAMALDYSNILNQIDPSSYANGQAATTSVIGQNPLNGNINVNVSGDIKVNGNVQASLNQGQFNSINGQLSDINSNISRVDGQMNTANQNWSNTNNQLENANNQLSNANANWNNTNTQVANANANWNNTNTQVANANTNWNNTNTQVANANANWSDTNKMVDRNWDNTNKQLSRANDIAEKMSDPKHMFLLSGATAAGAVFGASAATLAIDGMKMGLEWIIEQITDSKGKANRWALFAEARKNWDETIKQALNLENSIDQFLGHFQLLQDLKKKFPNQKINIEDIIRSFSKEIVKAKKILGRYQKEFDAADNARCEDELADKIVGQEEIIKELEDVSAILTHHLKENPAYDIFDERYFCSKMGEMLRNLLDAENTLQEYRIFMIDGKAEFADQLADRGERLYDKADRYNSKRDSLADREIKAAEESYTRAIDQLKEAAKANCEREGVSIFSKGSCVEEQLASGSMKSRADKLRQDKEAAINRIGRGYDDKSSNYLMVNQQTINQKMALYQDWFKELEEQQFCSQNPDDRGCQELSKFRYNGNFAIKDKAVDSMAQICPQQDMRLIDVNQKLMNQRVNERSPSSGTQVVSSLQSKSPASASVSDHSNSGGGVLSSLFSSVKNFFSSIADGVGNFFSGLFGKSVGESTVTQSESEYVAPSQVEIVDNYRAPAVSAEIDSASMEAKDILKTKYPEAYVALMRFMPAATTADFEKLLRAIETKQFVNKSGASINISNIIAEDRASSYDALMKDLFQ